MFIKRRHTCTRDVKKNLIQNVYRAGRYLKEYLKYLNRNSELGTAYLLFSETSAEFCACIVTNTY